MNGIQKLLTLIFLVATCSHAHPKEPSESIQTRQGVLEVRRGAQGSGLDSLFFKGKTVYRKESYSLGIYGRHAIGDMDYVVIGANCGGSGCSNDDLIIGVIGPKGRIAFTEDQSLRSSDGTVSISKSGNKLLFDLGWENGKQKRAIFDGKSLIISFEATKTLSHLSKDECEWIYDSALDGCLSAKEQDPTCSDPASSLPMFLARSLTAIAQNPSFVQARWEEICKQACTTGRAPRYEPFRHGFCRIN